MSSTCLPELAPRRYIQVHLTKRIGLSRIGVRIRLRPRDNVMATTLLLLESQLLRRSLAATRRGPDVVTGFAVRSLGLHGANFRKYGAAVNAGYRCAFGGIIVSKLRVETKVGKQSVFRGVYNRARLTSRSSPTFDTLIHNCKRPYSSLNKNTSREKRCLTSLRSTSYIDSFKQWQ